MRTKRALHPLAWWAWAIGVAVAASVTTNPLLLAVAVAVLVLVVVSRRGSSPWARAFRLYLWLGLFIVGIRLVLYVLVGDKYGPTLLVRLPEIHLPSWAAGITVFGPLRLEGLLATAADAARLAVMVVAVGAANALANPKRLLRSLPGALHDIGTAVVVSVTVAPQLADSVQRVSRARELRGEVGRGIRALPRVALPVLEDTLDRSLLLAGAMDGRGYGRRADVSAATTRTMATATLGGLLVSTLGLYGVLSGSGPGWLGLPLLAVGLCLVAAGMWLGGRGVVRSRYRPDPWLWPEWGVLACGFACAATVLTTRHLSPSALTLPVSPLAVPALPPLALLGLLVGALPAVLAPEPAATRRHP